QRAHAHLAPHRRDHLHRRVVHRREHEADAGAFDALRDLFGLQLDRRAQGFEHVGAAGLGRDAAVAVLGHLGPGRSDYEHARGGDVEGVRAVAAGTHDVDQMGSVGDRYRPREFPQHGRRAGDFADGLLLHPQTGEDGRGHGRRDFPAHDRAHQRDHFVVEDFAVFDGALERFLRSQGHGVLSRGMREWRVARTQGRGRNAVTLAIAPAALRLGCSFPSSR
ncbi:hypothetical protein CATMIT_01676, partial [Catenibacterium mitsuokai DSM 15897]